MYPESIVLSDQNKEEWYAGSVTWFGINRNDTHCDRCERTRTSLKIDVLDFIRERESANLGKLSFHIEGKGKLIKDANGQYKIYSMEEIVQDGTVLVNLNDHNIQM